MQEPFPSDAAPANAPLSIFTWARKGSAAAAVGRAARIAIVSQVFIADPPSRRQAAPRSAGGIILAVTPLSRSGSAHLAWVSMKWVTSRKVGASQRRGVAKVPMMRAWLSPG